VYLQLQIDYTDGWSDGVFVPALRKASQSCVGSGAKRIERWISTRYERPDGRIQSGHLSECSVTHIITCYAFTGWATEREWRESWIGKEISKWWGRMVGINSESVSNWWLLDLCLYFAQFECCGDGTLRSEKWREFWQSICQVRHTESYHPWSHLDFERLPSLLFECTFEFEPIIKRFLIFFSNTFLGSSSILRPSCLCYFIVNYIDKVSTLNFQC